MRHPGNFMRLTAIGLFVVAFAVTLWAIRITESTDPRLPQTIAFGVDGKRARPVTNESSGSPKAQKPVAASGALTEPPFELPAGVKVMSVRAELSDQLIGRLTRGTKVDLLLLPTGKVPVGPPELVVSGGYFVPTSMSNNLDEKTGEAVPTVTSISVAVTDEQAERLAAAEGRGVLLVVPAN